MDEHVGAQIDWPKVWGVLRRPDHINDKEYVALFGGFNDPFPNMKRTEPDTFWRQFSLYGSGSAQDFRQIDPKRIPAMGWQYFTSVHAFIYADGTGYAVDVAWKYPQKPEWVPSFYTFALCEHDRTSTLDTARGWHEGHCRKCGLRMNYDSGD